MADFNTKIADQDVTLLDVTEPGYTAPTVGYAIHLTDTASRNFLRLGELAELREERDRLVELRNADNEFIAVLNEQRTAKLSERDEKNTRITELNTRITEIVAWLQSQGDS